MPKGKATDDGKVVVLPVTGMTKERLEELAGTVNAYKAEQDTARGHHANAVKDYENTHGLHRKGFKDALKVRNMESTQQSAYMEAFKQYCEWFGVGTQQELPLDGQAGK